MPDHMQEFIDANGYAPFVLVALPMIALLVRSQATQEACNICVIVIILIVGGMGALFGDFALLTLRSALMPHETTWHAGMIAPTSTPRALADDATVPFWLLSPLSLAVTLMILLPGGYKVLAIVFAGIQLMLALETNEDLQASATLAEFSLRGRLETFLAELRANIALFTDLVRDSLSADPSAAGDAAPEAPAAEEGARRTYPDGTAPLPVPRPAGA